MGKIAISRITLAPRRQSGGSQAASDSHAESTEQSKIPSTKESDAISGKEESPRKRITLAPRLAPKGDIYKDKEEWSLPEVAFFPESIARFSASLKSETEAYVDTLVSRSGENTCAPCPFRAFSKKRAPSTRPEVPRRERELPCRY